MSRDTYLRGLRMEKQRFLDFRRESVSTPSSSAFMQRRKRTIVVDR